MGMAVMVEVVKVRIQKGKSLGNFGIQDGGSHMPKREDYVAADMLSRCSTSPPRHQLLLSLTV